jgi:hypothetical protein
MGARRPGPQGEHDISRKTIAWGMPDVSGASAVNTRVHTPTTKRTRGCGCIGHPAFPAPSYFRGTFFPAQLGHCLRREDAESRSPIVMLRFKRGIQYAVTSRASTAVSGILDRPVKLGDDDGIRFLKF